MEQFWSLPDKFYTTVLLAPVRFR